LTIKLYGYYDVLVSESFEGLPNRYNFTENEWYYIRQLQIPYILDPIPGKLNQLLTTKLLRKPLNLMKKKMKLLLK
jgi:hypothetical protein